MTQGLACRLTLTEMSNKDAASELQASSKTIRHHLTRICSKLDVRSRMELALLHRDEP